MLRRERRSNFNNNTIKKITNNYNFWVSARVELCLAMTLNFSNFIWIHFSSQIEQQLNSMQRDPWEQNIMFNQSDPFKLIEFYGTRRIVSLWRIKWNFLEYEKGRRILLILLWMSRDHAVFVIDIAIVIYFGLGNATPYRSWKSLLIRSSAVICVVSLSALLKHIEPTVEVALGFTPPINAHNWQVCVFFGELHLSQTFSAHEIISFLRGFFFLWYMMRILDMFQNTYIDSDRRSIFFTKHFIEHKNKNWAFCLTFYLNEICCGGESLQSFEDRPKKVEHKKNHKRGNQSQEAISNVKKGI